MGYLRKITAFFIAILYVVNVAFSHEIRPAYLEITQLDSTHYQVLWKVPAKDNKTLAIHPVFPNEFRTTTINKRLINGAQIETSEGFFEANLSGKTISINNLEQTIVDVFCTINLLGNIRYDMLIQADKPYIIIPHQASFWLTTTNYLKLGIDHILMGYDHLLFVLGLLLLVVNWKTLIKTITAFTLAHSITLTLASLQWFSLPQKPVEAVIALSIIFLAKEHIDLLKGRPSLTASKPWVVAFIFGLLHGFGFAGALGDIGFPQSHFINALLSFNVGVELGQLIFIGLVLSLFYLFKKVIYTLPKSYLKIPSYCIGCIAMFWLIQRTLGFL